MKPFFKAKSKVCNNIILNENDKTISDGKAIPNNPNKYFADIIKELNLEKDTGTSFESQQSCRMIKRNLEKKISLLKSLLKTRLQTQIRIYLKASLSNNILVSIMKKLLIFTAQN